MYRHLDSRRSLFAIVATVLVTAAAGCSPEEPKQPKAHKADGKIAMIDVAKGRVAMNRRDPKDSTRFLADIVEGTVTAKTEIWINGQQRKIDDLRVGDLVEAEGRVMGKDKEQQIEADSIRVTRAEMIAASAPVAPTPTVTPATQPTATAVTIPPTPSAKLTGPEYVELMIKEFKKHKQKFIEKRDALLAQGRPADDPEIIDLNNRIANAEGLMAQTEEIGAQKGIFVDPAKMGDDKPAPSSAPAASQPAGAPDS